MHQIQKNGLRIKTRTKFVHENLSQGLRMLSYLESFRRLDFEQKRYLRKSLFLKLKDLHNTSFHQKKASSKFNTHIKF